MQILRLLVENLRAVERLDVSLADAAGAPRRRVVFLGVNGAGKSTVLDAIAHAFASLTDAPGFFDAGDVRNVGDPPSEDGASRRQGVVQLEAELSPEERTAGRRRYPDVKAGGSIRFEVVAGDESASNVRNLEHVAFGGLARAALLPARSPCILLPADRGVLVPSDDLTFRQIQAFDPHTGALSRSRDRFASIAAHLALAAVAKDTEQAKAVERMWKVLAKYFPALPRPLPQAEGLTLRFRDARGATVALTALSKGERAILLLFGELALRSPKNGVVLIDELEQHLHPRWQKAALEALASLLPTAQFILTTQSPYLAACAPDDVIKLGDWDADGEG